jgi:hypothetical protein
MKRGLKFAPARGVFRQGNSGMMPVASDSMRDLPTMAAMTV